MHYNNKILKKYWLNLKLTHTLQKINKVVEFIKAYKQSSKFQVFPNIEGVMHWLKIPNERKMQIEVKLDYLETH